MPYPEDLSDVLGNFETTAGAGPANENGGFAGKYPSLTPSTSS